MKRKDTYTTGEAAAICKVSQQTIIRCFDSGRLDGFRVPGSTFRRIPHEALLAFMHANGIPTDEIETSGIAVLLIDDDADVVVTLAEALRTDGRFLVATAANGFDAGRLAQQHTPDVIVLDFMLPDIDAAALCTTLRETPELSHTRVLLLSSMVSPTEVARLRQAGADEFIKKPFQLDLVTRRIVALSEMK